jgi:lipoyl(octanoyl) transferase
MNSIAVLHLGVVDYGTALRLQETLVELRKQERVPNVLLLLEHPPVITLGRNAKPSNIVASREFLAAKGVEVFEINRGGDVTFHGPGQLVAYPIFDLRSFTPKLGAVDYVRKLEEVLMRTCAQYRIETQRIRGMTGVWTTALEAGLPPASVIGKETTIQAGLPGSGERKIAAIGVHISRGVTSHGFALNVSTDLEYFKLIVPCGISGKPVTSIQLETGARLPVPEVLPLVTRNFGFVFGSQILWLESLDDLLASALGAASPAAPAPGSPPRAVVARDGVDEPQDTPAKTPEELRRLHQQDTHFA